MEKSTKTLQMYDFLKLDIEEQVEMINDMLKNGLDMETIRNEINISKKKLQKIMKDNNYKYSQKNKGYVKHYDCSVDVIEQEIMEEKKLTIEEVDLKKELENLNTKVVELYRWYLECMDKTHTKELIIKNYDDTTVVKSYKIYSNVEKEFQSFCKRHKQYKVQDILSKCIEEFLEKYK